jgi:hypothetical protein
VAVIAAERSTDRGSALAVGLRWAVPGLVVLVAAGVPLLRWVATALEHPGTTWYGADTTQMELRALAASRGHLALGAFSVYGWQHLGPSLFYWLAPFYALSGQEASGLVAGTAVANLLGLTALVVMARAWAGEVAAWVATATVIAFLWRFGLQGLAVPWNPTLTIVPTALLLVAVAALVSGRRWALPVAAGLASWVVQAHLGTACLVAGMSAVGATAVVAAARRDGARPWRAPLRATAAVAAVLWALPLADQVAGTHNMTTVWHYMAGGELAGAQAGVTAESAFTPAEAAGEVGLVGSLLSGRESGRFVGPDRFYARDVGRSTATTVAFPLLLAADAALGVVCARRGHRFAGALGGVAVVGGALAYASVVAARGGASHHIVGFAAGIGLVAWLALGLGVATLACDHLRARSGAGAAEAAAGGDAADRTRRPLPHPALAAVAAVVLAAVVSAVRLDDRALPLLPRNAGYDDLATAVAHVARGTTVVDTPGHEGPLLYIVLALSKQGVDVRVPPGRQLSFTREQRQRAHWDTEVWVALADRRPPGRGWSAATMATDPAGEGVTIYTRPGPS